MGDVKRLTRSETYAANKEAFDQVFGDPFATPEPISGHYQNLKGRGLIAAMNNNFDEGKAARNPAAPSMVDFFCDVESIVSRNLSPELQYKFTLVYLEEDIKAVTPEERNDIEQTIGRLFRTRKISPVSLYFKTIRKPVPRRK